MPVFNFETGEFTGKIVNMDPFIYNNPLRRDLIHNVYHYFKYKYKIRTHRAMDKGDVAGSGKKPRGQKKTGMARIGNKRAPGRYKGGKAHGPVPKEYYFPLNEKIRLQALKSLLSARLYEEKIIIIDTEKLEFPKTSYLNEIMAPFK